MIQEQSVYRVYQCLNPECQGEFGTTQGACDEFCKICPACGLEELVIKFANASFISLIGINQARTFGMIGQKNQQEKERREGIKKKHIPSWRSGNKRESKINFDILKNPNKYIETGET